MHPGALCETAHVGSRTRIWAFVHILPGARIGADCNICDGVFVENDVVLGDRVTIKSGVQLWDGVQLSDDVFVGPNATFANDKFPRSRAYLDRVPQTIVEQGASLGANRTILPGVRIGRHAMIGAGAVVTADVPPFAIVMGNPSRITAYVDSAGRAMPPPRPVTPPAHDEVVPVVPGVTLHRLGAPTTCAASCRSPKSARTSRSRSNASLRSTTCPARTCAASGRIAPASSSWSASADRFPWWSMTDAVVRR